jgi:hypothetical protein
MQLMVCIAIMIGLELELKARGLRTYFPPRIILFAVLFDLHRIALFFWFIRRTRTRKLRSQGSQTGGNTK